MHRRNARRGAAVVMSGGVPLAVRPTRADTDWAAGVLHMLCLLFLVMLVAAAAIVVMVLYYAVPPPSARPHHLPPPDYVNDARRRPGVNGTCN